MKVDGKLIDGTEKEIEIRDYISGIERNNILDKSMETIQDGNKMKVSVKTGTLMTEVLKTVVKGVDVNKLSAETCDEIVSKFDRYFGQESIQKKTKESEKSTE